MRTTLIMLVVLLSMMFPAVMLGQQLETPPLAKGEMMLTIFLRHDESKTLDQIDRHLLQTGFAKNFPPQGVEVVSWYVMMGIGQVVTLRFPAERLREVNLAIEHGAWGAFRTEFCATYDYKPAWEAWRAKSH